MKAALQNYHARMQRVLDYIDQHLDGDLDLETVSRVAAFSKFHFHRQFAATFGLSAHRYVQLARLKRASHRLAYRDDESVTDIAMDAGYDAPDAFARAFRQRFGQSPSKLMQKTFTTDDVTIRDVTPTPVAIMEHRGDPATIGATVQRFIAWRKAAGLHPKTSPTFNVWRSERRPASPADYSMDLCVGTDRPIEANGEQIKAGEIPGGRCAVLRVVGNTHNLEPAALYLYHEWLPASGEEARDFPIYCQRLSFFQEVPEHEAVAELFLPLK
jgi:AraC family transcriptional regulator